MLTGLHIKKGWAAQNETGERPRAGRQAQAEEAYAEHSMKNNNSLQSLLLEKVEQRTYGGPYNLLRSFRKFDNDTTDGKTEIDFASFQQCLAKFGINGLPLSAKRKLFDSYDRDGSGTIDFKEFVDGVMNSRSEHNMLKDTVDHFAFRSKEREQMGAG